MKFQLIWKKSFRYFSGTTIAASSRIPFASSVVPTDLVLYLKDLKLSSSAATALLTASSLE